MSVAEVVVSMLLVWVLLIATTKHPDREPATIVMPSGWERVEAPEPVSPAPIPQSAKVEVEAPTIAESKDDGVCPPCIRPEEEILFRDITAITKSTVVIITKRNTRNSGAPRIAVDIEAIEACFGSEA